MTLFVGGVHAVGKTFSLKPICESLGIRHSTASQLIREQRGTANWSITKQVDDVEENQRALISAVNRIALSGEKLLLDGHFVLRRSVGVHEKIGIETYVQLMIRGVILLEAPSITIAERLHQRGDFTWEISEIELFSQAELEHATTVCKHMKVPLVRLLSPSEQEVREAVTRLM